MSESGMLGGCKRNTSCEGGYARASHGPGSPDPHLRWGGFEGQLGTAAFGTHLTVPGTDRP
eukprot:3607961-Lingulodinium_polyedra.AAC.1